MRPDWHKHKCPRCDFVWEHDGENVDDLDHHCPSCGCGVWMRYRGDDPPDHTDRPRELPPGLREITLTVEEATTIQQLLDDPAQPGHKGKEMPSADPSVLRRKNLKESAHDPEQGGVQE